MSDLVLGPVTQPLVDEVRELVATKTMVVWLDRAGHYTSFFDGLDDDPRALGSRLVGYRGSYLELMGRLADLTSGPDKRPLVVHVPGANKETIKDTPLLQLYEVAYPYERNLETLVRNAAAGRVTPDEVDAFLRSENVTLAHADEWLSAQTTSAGDALAAELRAKKAGPLIADLLPGRLDRSDAQARTAHGAVVRHALAARFGLPTAWPTPEAATDAPHRLAELAAQWVMAVEYAHDLTKPALAEILQPARKVSGALLQHCRDAAAYLRNHNAPDYSVLAQDFEDRLDKERDRPAHELGKIDTFSFEEDRLLTDALDGLATGDWPRAARWADERIDGHSVWLSLDPSRGRAWRLIRKCAALGQAIADAEKDGRLAFDQMPSLDAATPAYVEHGAVVDQHHRLLLQAADGDLLDRLPHEERLRIAVADLRKAWRAWGEERARAWTELTLQGGPLPARSLQQRTLFEDVVAPITRDGEKVALFVVDALRFEMAQELMELVGSPEGAKVRLSPRLCELPSMTEVGMNVLAPLARQGRLRPKLDDKRKKIKAWNDGSAHISTPDERAKAMGARVHGGQAKRWLLESILGFDTTSALRRSIRDTQLVVVHSTRIDKAGENRSGLAEFSRELRRLEKARQLLYAAGVRRFVITADHGFILREPGEEALAFGKHNDPKGRYAMYAQPQVNSDTYSVSLTALDYDDGGSEVLVFPRGLSVYAMAVDRDFVHGGNSPQERVIPVLTIEHDREPGAANQRYRIAFERSSSNSAEHRIELSIEQATGQVAMEVVDADVPLELQAVAPGVRVELVDATGARLEGGMVVARIGRRFSVGFRLVGPKEDRVAVRLICNTAEIRMEDAVSRDRFDVAMLRAKHGTRETPVIIEPEPGRPPAPPPDAWLADYDDPDARTVMAHIDEHGEATESDLAMLLGSARKVRRFSRHFETHAARAPFIVKIVNTPAGKAYRKLSDA